MGRATPLLFNLWETRSLEWMGTPWSSSFMLVARLTTIYRYNHISFLSLCSHNSINNCSFYKFLDKSFFNSFTFSRLEKSMEIFEINLSRLIKFKLISKLPHTTHHFPKQKLCWIINLYQKSLGNASWKPKKSPKSLDMTEEKFWLMNYVPA